MRIQYLIVLLAFLANITCQGQQFDKIILSEKDTSDFYINDGDSKELYYLKLVPKTKLIGAIVIFPSGGETTQDLLKQIELPKLAYNNGFITVIPSINWGMDDFHILDNIFKEIVKEHNIPKGNFVLGGLSNGGIISLTYSEKAVKEEGSTFLVPKGVFGLDVPLDDAHMYEYCQREIGRNFSEVGMNEAHYIMNSYNEMYGGSPEEFPEQYIEASIYSNGAKNGGNAQYLKNIPIRMYTDLDLEFLINDRRRDLYDWNGTDIVAMIRDLKLMGNEDANVIITMGKGVRLDGSRHPHSWSIMDADNCMNWIKTLYEE